MRTDTIDTIHRSRRPFLTEPSVTYSQLPWTAARCLRLLRPLSSKIALLRKLRIEGAQRKSKTAGPTEGRRHDKNKTDAFEPEEGGQQRSYREDTAEWDCTPRPRKKLKCTYSSRTRVQTVHSRENLRERCCDTEDVNMPPHLSAIVYKSDRLTSIRSQNALHQDCPQSGPFGNNVICSRHEYEQAHFRKTPLTRPNAHANRTIPGESKDLRKLQIGISNSFFALLKATETLSNGIQKGSKSLFATCLRQVPKYIAAEEYWAREEDPYAETDVLAMIYDELEARAISEGWKPLREVVKAHGLSMITSAIHEGLICPIFALSMADLCAVLCAREEVLAIVYAVLGIALAREAGNLESGLLGNWIRTFGGAYGVTQMVCNQPGALSSLSDPPDLREFSRLICHHLLCCLNSATYSILHRRDPAGDAARFICTFVRHSCLRTPCEASAQIEDIRTARKLKLKQSVPNSQLPLSEIVSGSGIASKVPASADSPPLEVEEGGSPPVDIAHLLAIILALSTMHQSGLCVYENEVIEATAAVIKDVAVQAHQYLELARLDPGDRFIPWDTRSMAIQLLAGGLFMLNSDDADLQSSVSILSDFQALSTLPLEDEELSGLGSFVHKFAMYDGHFRGEDAFDFIKKIVGKLGGIAKASSCCKATQFLLSNIIMRAAFAFSEHTSQPIHLDWALNVEQDMCEKSEASPRREMDRTPARTTRQVKETYKWEEGICEWIARTPAMQPLPPWTPSFSGFSTSDDGTKAVDTPMTSPEPDPGPAAPRSPCMGGKSRADAAESRQQPDYACVQFLRISVTKPEALTHQRSSSVTSFSQRSERDPLESSTVQSVNDYDDADELSMAQEALEVSATKLREHWRRTCDGGLRMRKPESGSVSLRDRASFRQTTNANQRAVKRRLIDCIDLKNGNSDGEDELSFL